MATAFDDYLPRQPKRNRDRNEEKRVAERGFIRDLRGRLIVSVEPEQRSVSLTRDGVDLPWTIMCNQVDCDTLSIFNEATRQSAKGAWFLLLKILILRGKCPLFLFIIVKGFEYLLLSKLIGYERITLITKESFTLIFYTHILHILHILRFKEIFWCYKFCFKAINQQLISAERTFVKFQINEWQSNID